MIRGIVRACEKTGIPQGTLEVLVDEIEAELQQRIVREVTSQEIGELVLQRLQSLSEVAYIRFASVYRQFQGIRDFVDTLNHLRSHGSGTEEEIKVTAPLENHQLPLLEPGETEIQASLVIGH